jgi:exodeoxyribonuclease VII large subunit
LASNLSLDPPKDTGARLLAETTPGDNAPALSVSDLAFALKRVVEDSFGLVRLRGEISGYKRAASGHAYLTLKDDKACLDAVMWKAGVAALPFRPEDGIEVIATGKLTTYPGRSKYQIVIERLELAGEGALMLLLEKLKAKLGAEGLFDNAAKKKLPFLPRRIGVVTSPTGAVIRDILHRLEDRCPTYVLVWPVLVQGQGAAEQVAAAIGGFCRMPEEQRPDLVIVARGGGSIEDLWAFNEEAVVRAVAGCTIPIISAVGHETDNTLCDYAADMRAPTPTAAAEMAVPVRAELRAHVRDQGARMERCARRYQERGQERLTALARLLPTPASLLDPQRQRVDDHAERLRRGLGRRVADARGELARAGGALRPQLLRVKLDRAADRLASVWRLAQSVNPENLLARGYAWVEGRTAAKVVTSAAAARSAGALRLHFADGTVDARVERATSAAKREGPDQPSLL